MRRRLAPTFIALTLVAVPLTAGVAQGRAPTPAASAVALPEPPKTPTAVGTGGAVSSVDPYASEIGLRVLEAGGNAVDAAVATAAALGVTEPYSAGIGGGGFFMHYDADTGDVQTIDGRETAPLGMPEDAFVNPETGKVYSFAELVSSGVSVGVPGTLATWQRALDRWGTRNLSQSIRPATRLARNGFVVDQTFHDQTAANQQRFSQFTPTAELFLPGGSPPAVGSTFRNPDLGDTYELIAERGLRAFYRDALARDIVQTVQSPTTEDATIPAPPGHMELSDLTGYRVLDRAPTRSDYRGYDVFGMRSSSSGGTTVGEALNIMERSDLAAMSDQDALHRYLEAGALSFADRGKYVGDEAFVDVPVDDLLSDQYAAERACLIDPVVAQDKPVPAGDVDDYDGDCATPNGAAAKDVDTEGLSTTNLTVADRWGNVVEYTLTIEQTGGAGIVVPDRGFLLNNELTDFTTSYPASPTDPNRLEPGKRPRSSMSPTIVLDGGEPFVALGSPGGSTIITTVLQMLFNRIDEGMDIEQAIAAPRASPRNNSPLAAEPAFIATYGALLEAYGHRFASTSEIGAATAIEFGPSGQLTAVAEPSRRGGGSARVVDPVPSP